MMASYPFGLREDPFAAGFELTPEETRQLVQHRVSAFGGDGAALFPPETCAEIHRRAHGVASAALKLAEHALLRAAREGAASVSPAHVHPDAAEAPARAAGPAVPAPEPEPPSAPSSPALVIESLSAPPPAAATSPTRIDVAALRSSLQAAIVARSQPVPDPTPSRPATVPATPPLSPPRLEVITSPPVRPEPAAASPSSLAAAPDLSDRTWSTHARSTPSSGESTPWTASVGVFLVFVAGTVLLVVLLHPAGPAMRSFARTSIAAKVGVPPPPQLRTQNSPIVARLDPPAVTVAPAPDPKPAVSAPAESSRVDVPGFGLEVASFIVRERAQAERKRLTAAGRNARIVTGWDNGAAAYRVVVGPFPTAADAERAADQMLERGLVNQARVVTVKPPAPRPQ
jgi:hypothetical protein